MLENNKSRGKRINMHVLLRFHFPLTSSKIFPDDVKFPDFSLTLKNFFPWPFPHLWQPFLISWRKTHCNLINKCDFYFNPLLNTLLAETRFLPLQPLLITFIIYYFPQLYKNWLDYDLQLHLRKRNAIWNKESEERFCSCTKIFLDKVVNFKDFSRPNKEINSTFHYSRTFTEFKDFSR